MELESTASHSVTTMNFTSNHQYGSGGGGGDDRSMGSRGTSSIGMASSAKAHNGDNFIANEFNSTTQDTSSTSNDTKNNDHLSVKTPEDALTAETQNAVTKERQMLYKENAAKLQSILENIKNSTKNILREMDAYLQETEEVEKIFIGCRANTQKESQRMEQVEPDVIAATQRFMAQGAQLFGGANGTVNLAALMSFGAGGDAPMGLTGVNPGAGNGGVAASMIGGMVTPRGNDGASMAGSSVAGSMH